MNASQALLFPKRRGGKKLKNWIFSIMFPTTLASRERRGRDHRMEKVDHFVGKNQCNHALLCDVVDDFSSLKMRVSSLWFSHSWREWERKTEKWKFQRHLERMSLITNLHWIIKHVASCFIYTQSVPKIVVLLHSWWSSHENWQPHKSRPSMNNYR